MKQPAFHPVLPTSLALLGIISVQFGSAISKQTFSLLHPIVVTFGYVTFAAFLFCLYWRPRFKDFLNNYRLLIPFALSAGLINLTLYSSFNYLPVGVAVALQFTGPLGLSIIKSRRLLDLIWVSCAAIGILLLAPIGNVTFSLVGIILPLLSGFAWATYIVTANKLSRVFQGGEGIAIGMFIAATMLLPVAIIHGGNVLLTDFSLWLPLGTIALFSSVIPFSLEMKIFRLMPIKVFAVLMALEPAVATVVGFIFLGEALAVRPILGIILITIAGIGVSVMNSGKG